MNPSLIEHALARIAAAEIEPPERAGALRAELEAWRAASAEHAAAFGEAMRRWQALSAVGPGLKERFAEPRRRQRRRFTGALALLFLTGAGAGWLRTLPVHEQALRTGVAQLATATLPDGSRIDASAQSALAITYHRDRRSVTLERGEARFDVAADAARPFRVVTPSGVVEVLGTLFTVAERGERLVVEVERGRVSVTPQGAAPLVLSGGERIAIRGTTAGPIEPLGAREPGAWREGWLVFDNERLDDALAAINAFRAAPIVAADARTASLRLTGRFRATDSQALLAALPRILPVKVDERPDASVRLSAR